LKAKIAEAKEMAESVIASETYKKSHSTLSKPAVVAASAPKKSTEVKKEDKPEDKKEEKKEEKKVRESRSVSRKRNSIWNFGKKEEKVDPKEETAATGDNEEAAVSSYFRNPIQTN
jgi:hypothetical protein